MKKVQFLGNTLNTIRGWDEVIKQRVGYQLGRIQSGINPSDYKSMSSIGVGVYEIRIQIQGQWRVVYTAKFEKVVYVLAAFQKQSTKTAHQEIINAKHRLKTIT